MSTTIGINHAYFDFVQKRRVLPEVPEDPKQRKQYYFNKQRLKVLYDELNLIKSALNYRDKNVQIELDERAEELREDIESIEKEMKEGRVR